ncbi:MAG: SDR family NAD(P)-dependent oxidoreductase [Akkermansiaceae bacterium]
MQGDHRYRCALVTGASSGLGEEYARAIAPSCEVLVIVARRKELLDELAIELSSSSPATEVHCVSADLTVDAERAGLFKMLNAMALVPDLLINNAGMGDYGSFDTSDWKKIDAMLQVNITALTHLCHVFLPGMLRQERGAIINVSSLASALPMPDFTVYAATKAYVSSFSEALRLELREFNIPVLAVCPGPVHTGFGKIAIREESADALPSREGFYVTKEKVITDSMRALRADKARVYPGWKIAMLAGVISLMPMALVRVVSLSRRGKI